MGDEMSGDILKDEDEVRSLTKSVRGSYQSLCFKFDLTNPASK